MPGSGVSSLKELNSLADTPLRGGGASCTLVACRTINMSGGAAYVQLFNAAAVSDIVLGTTVPSWVVKAQPADVSDGDGLPTDGLLFDLGLFAASTTTPTGATPATQHVKLAIW